NNYLDISSLPFQIPLGALIPQRVENLLPGCKNLGVTHLTNGCFRLHPVEWNVGEAAGMLAAYCLRKKLQPRGVRVLRPEPDAFRRSPPLAGNRRRGAEPRAAVASPPTRPAEPGVQPRRPARASRR